MNLRCFKIHLTYSCRSIFLELTFKRLYLSVESGLFLKPHTFSPDSCEWDLKLLWRERCQNNAFSVTVFSGFVQPIRVKKVAGFKKISRFLRKSLRSLRVCPHGAGGTSGRRSMRASSLEAGLVKKGELSTTSLEFEYLHRKKSMRNADWRR